MKTVISIVALTVAIGLVGPAFAQTGQTDTSKPAATSSDPAKSTPSAPSSSTTEGQSGAMKSDPGKSDAMKPAEPKADAGRPEKAMRGADHERVKGVQQALKDKGFYQDGEVDGLMGPKTRKALRDFQQKEGLQMTGRLDSGTMDKLGAQAPSASPATGTTGDTASGPMSTPPKSDRDAAKGGMDRPGKTTQPQTK